MRKSPEKKLERDRVRMTLMRATLELAESHGFSGLGLREVSRAAGIAPTSFYRHFADVEELGLGIIERLVGPLLTVIVEAAESAVEKGHDPIAAIVEGLFEAAIEDPALIRFVLSQHSGSHASFRRSLREQFKGLQGVLAPCMPEGSPKAAPTVALAGILLGCDQVLEAEPADREAMCMRLCPSLVDTTRWLLHGHAAKGGGDGG